MPVPNTIADLSQAAASNSPLGTDTVGPNLDDYLRAISAFVRQLFDGTPLTLGAVGGTGDAITATTASAPFTAYVMGQLFRFLPTAANTGPATININGIGTKSITKNGTVALAAGDLAVGVATVLFYDGTQFQIVSGLGSQITSGDYSRVSRLYALNNLSTPTRVMDMSAVAVVLRDANNKTVTRTNVGTLSCNINTAGPAANGRDQAAAFSASSTVHFYFIWNPATSTIATIASLVAPPVGPTLPTGYTHWAYALSVVLDASANMYVIRAFGKRVTYVTSPSLGTPNASTTGSYGTYVPAIAETWSWRGSLTVNADGSGNCYASLGIDSGITNQVVVNIGTAGVLGALGAAGRWNDLPNISGQVITYVISVSAGSGQATTNFVVDYVVPNY